MVLGVRSPMADARATTLVFAADVARGCAAMAWNTACPSIRKLARGGARLGRLFPISISPELTRVLSPDGLLNAAARCGHNARSRVGLEVDRIVRALAPDVVRAVLDQLDLTAIVRERVDIDAVVEDIDVDAVAARLDLDLVAARLDIGQIIDRVDVDAVAARVDLDAIVARLDLIGLADFVVDGIDLPGIIRESSGSMASEALRGVRLQSLEADDAVSRVVSRWLLRRRLGAPTAESAAVSRQADDGGPVPAPRAPTDGRDPW